MALVLLPMVSESAASVFSDARHHQAWLWFYGTNVLQSQVGGWPFGCFDHFWSLAVEEHFYFVWPLVILFARPRTAIAACVFVIALSLTTRVAWLVLGGNDVAPEVFTLFRADALAVGALAALLARHPGGMMRLAAWSKPAGWILGLTLAALTIANRRWLTIPDTLFAAFFGCIVVAAVSAPAGAISGRLFGSSWLRFFGKYSYGMYIFQYPLIPILAPILSVELLSTALGSGWVARVVYIVLMTSITTLVAFTSWHLYERHFLSLKRLFPSGAVRTG
jgi:peptidoglycan/LPS O-acetylase OafA/YrhL